MTELNREAWESLVQEDIDWLEQQPLDKVRLEYRHIIDCMKWLKANKPTQRMKVDMITVGVWG